MSQTRSHLKKEELRFRSLQIAPEDICADGVRKLRVCFSSEAPVLRVGDGKDFAAGERYYEALDHSPENADLSLLQDGGALIDEHDWTRQFGSVEKAWIDADRKGRADICFADTDLANERWQLMSTGHRKDISFGYIQIRVLSQSTFNGLPLVCFAWAAHEITSTAVGADHFGTGVGRSANTAGKIDFSKLTIADISALTKEQKQRMKLLLDPNPAEGGNGNATIDEAKVRSNALTAERTRVKEITAAADLLVVDHPQCREQIRSIVNESIAKETSIADFQIRAMKEVLGAKKVQPITMAAVGMSEAEQRSYSVLRGIQSCLRSNKQIPDGLEGEVHKELQTRASSGGLSFEGFAVPHDANVRCKPNRGMQRDLNVSVFSQGGASVQTSIVTPIIEILRNRMVTDKLGIQQLSGLSGNVAIPRQTGAATAYSLAESATLTKSTQALDQILLAPHRVGATNDYTRQLLLQSSIDVENFIRDDLMKVIAIKWDALILNGQGAGSEPLGILNTPGIGSIVFGGTCTYAKVIAFETALATLNADGGNMAYATTPSVRGAWKAIAAALSGATAVINGAQNALWAPSGTPGEGEVNGYRAIASNQIPNNGVIFGNWSEVIQGLYGGYDVIVNPYSRDVDAAVRITINTFGDVALRHAASFAASADAGNQ